MRLEEIFIRETVSTYFACSPNKILGIYLYGSRLYGTDSEDSDWDFVVVVDGLVGDEYYKQHETEEFDIHLMTLKHYNKLLLEHNIMALECYYQQHPIMKCQVEFQMSLPLLRKSISSVVNNSWVKARKKMEIKDECSYIGLKSLFHSFRILDFGIQIALMNTIHYQSANGLWIELKEQFKEDKSWESYYKNHKAQHNELMTQFRKAAPKEIKNV